MLSEFYPPIVGGIQQHVQTLSIELAARGHEVSVVTSWQEGLPKFEIDRGVRIHRIRGVVQRASILFSESERRYMPPFPDPGVMHALRRIIQQERPEIVHAHDWTAYSFTLLKAWSKAKFIVSLHSYSHACVQKRMMQGENRCTGPGLMKCIKCATEFYGVVKGPVSTLSHGFWSKKERHAVDMFLPVSRSVLEGNRLIAYKVPHRIIPNFIPDTSDIAINDTHPLLKELPEKDFLLFVGDVTLDKGVGVLLQAYAEMRIQIPLVIIGRPTTDLPTKFPLTVFVTGKWPHEVVMSAWKRCIVGLAPSIWHDPCPTVAMEAMAMGKPVIASRIGGLSDIISDGETGILVEPGNPEALGQAMQLLIDNPEQRKYMGTLAAQKVTEFQAKTVVSRIEEVYHDLLQA
jgi:glycosyltransferase involved in cell wall biosynthesis